MKKYIHGTDYDSAMNIVANGLSDEKDTVWSCSDPECIYCRDAEEEDALWQCIESGQIAAAYRNSLSTKIGIIEIAMDDSVAEDIVEDDTSCENMYGCYQINIDSIKTAMRDNHATVTVRIYGDSYVPYLRPFYLAYVCEQYMVVEDALLRQAIDVVKRSESYIFEDLLEHGELEQIYHVEEGK